jgi:DNA invertase Pin-like site-specific DNA recombinase
METATKKAFGYIRVSGESQVKEDGPVRQRSKISAYAKANNIKIVRWFVEEAVSGTVESKDRPAFGEMLVALMSNGVRTVLIENLDRVARDLFVQEGTIRLLKQKGFELISVDQPDLCNDDLYRKAMRQMMGVFAELDRGAIVLKLRAARQRKKVQTGRCEGRKPFGTKPGEAEVLAFIEQMHSQGSNNEKIAQELNTKGIKSRSGGKWYSSTLYNILKRNTQATNCN